MQIAQSEISKSEYFMRYKNDKKIQSVKLIFLSSKKNKTYTLRHFLFHNKLHMI